MYHTEIRVKGKINPIWSDWFGEMHIHEGHCDETLLIGELPDMAAVYGVISRLGSLVIPLISVNCIEESEASNNSLAEFVRRDSKIEINATLETGK